MPLNDEFYEKINWIESFSDKYQNPETWFNEVDPDDRDEWSLSFSHFQFIEEIFEKKFDDFKEEDLKYGNHIISDKIKELYEKEFGIDKTKIIFDPEYSCLYIYFYDKEEIVRYLNWSYKKFIRPTVDKWKIELKYNKVHDNTNKSCILCNKGNLSRNVY